MARYIDVGKLLKELTISPDGTKIPDVDCDSFPVKIDLRILRRIILRQPTADVVEVVRCKGCTHRVDYYGRLMCGRLKYEYKEGVSGLVATVPEHFCSYGERKVQQ